MNSSNPSQKIVFGLIGGIIVFMCVIFVLGLRTNKTDTLNPQPSSSTNTISKNNSQKIPSSTGSTTTGSVIKPTSSVETEAIYEKAGNLKFTGYKKAWGIDPLNTNDPRSKPAPNITDYNYLKLVVPGTESNDNSPTTDFVITWDTKIYIDNQETDHTIAESKLKEVKVSNTLVYYAVYKLDEKTPINLAVAIFAYNTL